MKTILTLLLGILSFQFTLSAQGLQWGQPLLSEARDGIWDIQSDEAGNIYVTGFFEGDMDLDGTSIIHEDGQEFFLAKFSGDGELLWVNSFTGEGFDRGDAIVLDENGHVFLGGLFSGTMDIQGTEITSAGNIDILIARFLTSTGALDWVETYGGLSSDICYGLHMGENALYAVGHFYEDSQIGGVNVSSNGISDAWVMSLNPETAEANWVNTFGGAGIDRLYSVVEDSEGNVSVTGYYSDEMMVGGEVLNPQNGGEPFIVKLNPGGNPIWAKAFPSPNSNAQGRDLVIDDEDNYYISGFFGDSIIYQQDVLYGSTEGSLESFLISLSSDGDWRWGKSTNTPNNSSGALIALQGNRLYQAVTLTNGTGYSGQSITDVVESGVGVFGFDLEGNPIGHFIFDGPFSDYALPINFVENELVAGVGFNSSFQVFGETFNGAADTDVLLFRFFPEGNVAVEKDPIAEFDALVNVIFDSESQYLELELMSDEVDWVRVFTIDGRLIFQQEAENYIKVQLPNFNGGILFLQLNASGQMISQAIPVFR